MNGWHSATIAHIQDSDANWIMRILSANKTILIYLWRQSDSIYFRCIGWKTSSIHANGFIPKFAFSKCLSHFGKHMFHKTKGCVITTDFFEWINIWHEWTCKLGWLNDSLNAVPITYIAIMMQKYVIYRS